MKRNIIILDNFTVLFLTFNSEQKLLIFKVININIHLESLSNSISN